ncbi:hypothetical protein EV651_10777 [Kribbella sp. VKM Ac-2571]|uniref:hypothetical protein n=1 Tax=Kribbella sp. VKM Ac-2571 TaxID=2512222 RepID=UPI00105B2474|nr:hypothetical protein [Kribbella sp. VKM Ac-2571]TDO60805.1 hypothetical protein EV651_10777 [Kribbella sp. VKM Ac-2571]
MRTEQDLHEAFQQLADHAPHPGTVRAALEDGPPASRRTALIAGTALATATAAVAAVVVPHVISSDSSVADRRTAGSAWSHWVDLNLPNDFHAVGQKFSANRQDYELFDAGERLYPTYCQLQLHRNGDFDPATIPAGSPTIDISGHQARVVTSTAAKPFLPEPRTSFFSLTAKVSKTLVWEPVDGMWALLACEAARPPGAAPIEADLGLETRLASPISPVAGSLRSPLKLGYLPEGLTPREVRYQPGPEGIQGPGPGFTVLLGDANPGTGYLPPKPSQVVRSTLWEPDHGDDLSIRYDTSKSWDQLTRIRGNKPDAVIHGMKAYFTDQTITYSKKDPSKVTLSGPLNTLRLEANGVAVVIVSYTAHPTKDELIRIASSMELTNSPNNPANWFDAATSIP